MEPNIAWKERAIQSLDNWVSEGDVATGKVQIIEAIEREGVESNFLKLHSLGLTTLPSIIGEMPGLEKLWLFSNKLKTLPPEVSRITNLQYIFAFDNDFRSLPPELGLCSNLIHLSINDNPDLLELPMSLGQIPLTYLDVSGTGVSEQMRDSILEQCQLLRSETVNEEIPSRLNTWKTMANSDVDWAILEGLTGHQKIDLNEWLVRLERTRDFMYSQGKLAAIVCDMLKSVCAKEEFKELFFVQVAANNCCCEDRAAMSLNEIYTSWKSGEGELKIMVGVAKTLALRFELGKLIPPNERESVEIYLYYETLLKRDLQLCTAIDHMSYASIGKRDWIDQDALVKAVNETFFAHLLSLPAFEKLVKKELKQEWESIEEKALEELEALGERPTGDDLADEVLTWNHKQGMVIQEKNRAWAEGVKKWYDNQ